MRIAVIYDFGVNKGGGDFVMLNVLEALNNAGCSISLFTSYPQGLYESAKFFEKTVLNVSVYHVKLPSYFRHPYTITYIARSVLKVGCDSHDMYFISDDIPKCIISRKGVCYMHYPHAARFKLKEYITSKYKTTLRGKLTWKLHEIFFPRFYLTSELPENWLVIANSFVTREHIARTFHADISSIKLLNPPVSAQKINEIWKSSRLDKENLVVCIGRLEPDKQFTNVLYALARLKDRTETKLCIIGFAHEKDHHIHKVIRKLGLEKSVELLVNAERKTLINRLLRAKAIVHPTPHEPFGIAVVEGMSAGCIPIVRRGFNGPWLEIIEEGKYGRGFSNTKELAQAIENVIKFYDDFNTDAIYSRALEFDEAKFRQKFVEMIDSFIEG